MNEKWLKIIYTLTFISYALSFILYIPKLYHYIDINNFLQVLNYSTVVGAFLSLSWYTFENTKKILAKDKPDLKDMVGLYHSPARLGYGLLAVNFIIIITMSWSNGEPFYFQRLIALIGYLCLAFKIDIGAILVIIFYMFNLFRAVKADTTDYILALSKFIQMFYYGTYVYVYILLQISKSKKKD